MSQPPPAPLELEDIPLPHIPGPLPPTFFTEAPAKSLAVFSTHLSTRPFRRLPSPVPPLVIRSASQIDVESKAWFLLHLYPEVAESIFTPPAAWSDLYHYFDAMELWTEGAGFLFHVLGFLVRVNWTRFNCLRNYADQWALTHEMRLLSMPILQPALLSSVFTEEDDAWFDVGNLTVYQKNALTVVLNSHCGVLQAKRDSLQTEVQKNIKLMESQTQRFTAVSSLDYHEHQRRPRTPPFSSTRQKLSGASPSFVPKLRTAQQQTMNGPAFIRSSAQIGNTATSHVYTRPSVFMHETHSSSKFKSSGYQPDKRLNLLDNGFGGSFGNRESTQNTYGNGPLPTLVQQISGPVYVFNDQTSSIYPKHEFASTSCQPYTAPYPLHHSQQNLSMNNQGRSSSETLKKIQHSSNVKIFSDDARVYYEGEFAQRQNESYKPRNQNPTKATRTNDILDAGCTLFVGGLSPAALKNEGARELFAKCGTVKSIKTLLDKGCCFVEFTDPHSAALAINTFHKYVVEDGMVLTVQYPKSRGNNFAQKRRTFSQNYQFKSVSPRRYISMDSDRRVTGRSLSSFSRDSTPSSLNSNPPHRLPPKPQCQSSTSFNSQMNFVERLIQTANGNEMPAHFDGAATPVDELKSDDPDRMVYEPTFKTTTSSKKKKRYIWKSESPDSSPTNSARKQYLNPLSKDLAKPEDPSLGNIYQRTDLQTSKPTSVTVQSSRNVEKISTPELRQDLNTPVSFDLVYLKDNQCIPQQEYGAEARTPPNRGLPSILSRNLHDSASVHVLRTFSDVSPEDTNRAHPFKSVGVTESLLQHTKSTPSVETKQNRKPYYNNKGKLGKSSKAASKGPIKDITSANRNLNEDTAKRNSKESLEIRLKIRINEKCSNNSFSHDTQPKSGKTIHGYEIDKRRRVSSHSILRETTTPPSSHSRQKPRREKRPSQSPVDMEDDVFGSSTSTGPHDCRKSDAASQGTLQTNSSPKSTRTSGSETRRIMSQVSDESPTPKGMARPKLVRKPSQAKSDNVEKKENIQLSYSTTLLLSDLSEWPALGTTKAQSDTTVTKSLVVRSPRPGSTRRDSLASVMSSASPRPVRRLTTTAVSPQSSCGSPLWPVVKRWDIPNPSTKRI